MITLLHNLGMKTKEKNWLMGVHENERKEGNNVNKSYEMILHEMINS